MAKQMITKNIRNRLGNLWSVILCCNKIIVRLIDFMILAANSYSSNYKGSHDLWYGALRIHSAGIAVADV